MQTHITETLFQLCQERGVGCTILYNPHKLEGLSLREYYQKQELTDPATNSEEFWASAFKSDTLYVVTVPDPDPDELPSGYVSLTLAGACHSAIKHLQYEFPPII